MTKNRAPTPVYLDPGMHSGLEVKGLIIALIRRTRLKYVLRIHEILKGNDSNLSRQ